METLLGYTGVVKFVVPAISAATFKVYRGDDQIGGWHDATLATGLATATLPYEAVKQEGVVKVVLSYSFENANHEQTKYINVVTPILEIYEVKELLNTVDDNEAFKLEAAVRSIINAHTGQTFGLYEGKIPVRGTGAKSLHLPKRLVSLNTINDIDFGVHVYVDGGGWYLSNFVGYPTIKSDLDTQHISGPYASDGPIYAPRIYGYADYVQNLVYNIDGRWGWESVPEPVREAAKLLINDYACEDSAYRDRYLTSMTAADWRIQFNQGAFVETGNVRADQLLAEYVLRRGWAVL